MIYTPVRLFGEQDNKQMLALIDPDEQGPWALRYVWVQHRFDNDAFYDNYFDPNLSQVGMNIRKQTAELSSDWSSHNQIFYDSATNGDLVWRVKVGNPTNKSIDYVEIWRSAEVLEKHFGNNSQWDNDSRASFREQLYDKGFDIRELSTYPSISRLTAMKRYKLFVEQWQNKQQCIINTPWNKELNPLLVAHAPQV